LTTDSNDRAQFNRESGQIKFTWPQRELGSNKIVRFLVHWIGSDALADFTYEQPDECNLNERAYKQMLTEIPDARYMWESFEELEELCERFKDTTSVTWQQLLSTNVDELWPGAKNVTRRVACHAKRLRLINDHIAAAWHLEANKFLVHWQANEYELAWNKDEFQWLAHGFAVLNDRRLHGELAKLTPNEGIYPWSDGKAALALINDDISKDVLEYKKKQPIQGLIN
jgi:hypothetical protein